MFPCLTVSLLVTNRVRPKKIKTVAYITMHLVPRKFVFNIFEKF